MAAYEIRVRGHLDHSWSEWFADLTITALPGGETLLAGPLPDQAALHGVLARVRDLGLPLLAVHQLDEQSRTTERPIATSDRVITAHDDGTGGEPVHPRQHGRR